MTNDIVLKRNIAIKCWRVQSTIAKAIERDEMMPILMHIREKGETSAERLASDLFFEEKSRKAVAWRLLSICETLSLVTEDNKKFTLLEAGYKAIETKKIFIPEEGHWTIWASNDPLLNNPVLTIKSFHEPSSFNEVLKSKEQPKREFKPLPDWLTRVESQYIKTATDDEEIRFDQIKKQAEPVEPPDGNLQLIWNVTRKRLQLKGSLDGQSIETDLPPPEIAVQNVWSQLLEDCSLLHDWDEQSRSMAVAFDTTKDNERIAMTKDLNFKSPQVTNFGQFDEFTARNIIIRARSDEDAQDWAHWRLLANIDSYAFEDSFEQWQSAAKAPFPEFRITLPTRRDLAEQSWQNRENNPSSKNWHLIAVEDWQL